MQMEKIFDNGGVYTNSHTDVLIEGFTVFRLSNNYILYADSNGIAVLGQNDTASVSFVTISTDGVKRQEETTDYIWYKSEGIMKIRFFAADESNVKSNSLFSVVIKVADAGNILRYIAFCTGKAGEPYAVHNKVEGEHIKKLHEATSLILGCTQACDEELHEQ